MRHRIREIEKERPSAVGASVARVEAFSLLSCVGAQLWFREHGRPGNVHAEVALPLGDGGQATVKLWGVSESPLYVLQLQNIRGAGVVRETTRAQYDAACALNRQLAAVGRFSR